MAAPPRSVLAAFGADGPLTPLTGGQGASWRAGTVVLKPLDRRPEELAYEARLLARLREGDAIRLARPLRAADGRWVVDGWCATTFVEGRHEAGRWVDVVAAGECLHAALAGEPRPALLDARTDRWAVADRVAFGEVETPIRERLVDRLLAARRPLRAPSQLVHGDLTGNVLFADGLPPAILDLSLYWRPTGFATAVVLADALVFEGAGEDLAAELLHVDELDQLLLRALLFRLVTDRLARPDEPVAPAYSAAVELALRLTARR